MYDSGEGLIDLPQFFSFWLHRIRAISALYIAVTFEAFAMGDGPRNDSPFVHESRGLWEIEYLCQSPFSGPVVLLHSTSNPTPMKSAVLLLLVFSASASLTSCSSTTVMNSKPQGAKLYMDGQFKGETPFPYSDTKIVGSTTTIKLTLPGYEPFDGILSRNERADVGAIVGGALFLSHSSGRCNTIPSILTS